MFRILFLLLVLLVTGCNVVYKQNIQQGNVLDRDDMERLETGMTKRQVMVLLGSPAIEFENDRVVDFSGNYLEDAEIAGTELEELEIIDPNTNQPVLPPRDIEDDPVPTRNDPDGG